MAAVTAIITNNFILGGAVRLAEPDIFYNTSHWQSTVGADRLIIFIV